MCNRIFEILSDAGKPLEEIFLVYPIELCRRYVSCPSSVLRFCITPRRCEGCTDGPHRAIGLVLQLTGISPLEGLLSTS